MNLDDLIAATLAHAPAETETPHETPAQDPAQAALDTDACAYLAALDATYAQAGPADPMLLHGPSPTVPTPAPQGEQAPVDLLLGATVPGPTPAQTPATLQAKLAEISARLASRTPAQAPRVSRADRAHAAGGEAEFTKLPAYKGRPARWALLVFGADAPQVGTWVKVARKDGTVEAHEVTRVLFQKGQGWVCEFLTLKAVPVCPGNNNCRRLGHRRGRNCR